MMPSNIKDLLVEVALHKRREHEREKNGAIEKFAFEMSGKGLSKSGAFINGASEIYCEVFENFASLRLE